MYHLRIVCELPTSCCLRFFAPSLASDIHAFAPLCRSLGLFPTIPSLIRVYVVCCSPFVLAFLNQNRHSKCLLCVHAYYSLSLTPSLFPSPALLFKISVEHTFLLQRFLPAASTDHLRGSFWEETLTACLVFCFWLPLRLSLISPGGGRLDHSYHLT